MLRRVMSRLSVEIFLTRSTEKLRRGTFLCCVSKIPVAKKFMDKRGGREGASRFSVNFFGITVPKKFEAESFNVSLISDIEKY